MQGSSDIAAITANIVGRFYHHPKLGKSWLTLINETGTLSFAEFRLVVGIIEYDNLVMVGMISSYIQPCPIHKVLLDASSSVHSCHNSALVTELHHLQ